MNIEQWRKGLKTWLERHVLIDTWELRNPSDYGLTNGLIVPLQGLAYLDDEVGSCRAVSDLYLTRRYKGNQPYWQLPLGEIEQLYLMISRGLAIKYREIAPDLLDLQLLPVGNSVDITEYGESTKADWMVTMAWSMEISWLATVTQLPGDIIGSPGNPIVPESTKEIEIGLFTELVSAVDHKPKDKVSDLIVQKTP